ncbi:MAG: hypothetical protein E7491_02715 [Ruminococcaceae bacterium]|nr:hypothetical protein [Oscillospiraceae bacterium]
MSIFDKLKKTVNEALNGDAKKAPSASTSDKETFTFEALPESLAELKALPEAAMDTPFKTAALTVCALCAYAADKQVGVEMLNFLLGPRPLNNVQKSFLNDRFMDGHHVPFSYFKGAVPENDYTPDTPFTITVEAGTYSDANAGEGYKKLFIRSGGADSPREIVLRMRGDGTWFLWEQFLLVSIRKAKSDDPWA